MKTPTQFSCVEKDMVIYSTHSFVYTILNKRLPSLAIQKRTDVVGPLLNSLYALLFVNGASQAQHSRRSKFLI